MKLALVLGMLAVTAPQQPPPTPDAFASGVQGVIRFVQDGRRVPVPYALIEVVGSDGRRYSTMADEAGAYRIARIPAGRHRLRALHIGYEPIEVRIQVPPARTVEMDLVLRGRPIELPGLRVVAEPGPTLGVEPGEAPLNAQAAGLVRLRALEASPGLVESGLGDAVRPPPGNEPTDPTDVLLMRGSTADLKLVLLDGAPVYAPFHTGGLFQGFQVSTLGTATHHVGGAPARYDGGLSYVLDLRTRPGRRDRIRASGSADLLGLQGSLEAPLGDRAGVLAAGRGLHGAAGRLAGGDGSPYGYRELLVRGDVDAGGGGRFSATAFTNREAVYLGTSGSPVVSRLDEASWGNDAFSARWASRVGRTADLEIGVANSSYRAELPVRLPASGDDEQDEEGPRAHVASGTTERTRVTADLRLPGIARGLRAGASFDQTHVAYGSRTDGVSSLARSHGSVLGAYVERLHDLGGELDLRYGMRLDRFAPGGVKGALRLAVLWSLAPDALLTVAGGRYHQLARLGDTDIDLVLGGAPSVGTAPEAARSERGLLRAATADHLTLSLAHGVTPEVRLGFEGYVKRFRGLDPSVSPELASSGADLTVVREGDATTAWLGYSLAWFWEPGSTPDQFSGRHLLSAGLEGAVAGPVGVDLRASFSDGLPLTAVAFDASPLQSAADETTDLERGNGELPLPRAAGFLRLDAEVFAEWTPEWGSRTWWIRPYVKVLNALDRRDSLFYYFEPWRSDGLRPLAELSVLPVVGLEWRF